MSGDGTFPLENPRDKPSAIAETDTTDGDKLPDFFDTAAKKKDHDACKLSEDGQILARMVPESANKLPVLEITADKTADRTAAMRNHFKELFDTDKGSIYSVTKDAEGKEVFTLRETPKEGEKLPAGDYLIRFHRKDGKPNTDREFGLHIPKRHAAHDKEAMPELFALHGVMPRGFSPHIFARTVDLAKEADEAEIPFITIWPYAAKNTVGGSQSHFWIADNTPLRPEHVKENADRLGYKDGDFIAALPDWIRRNTDAEPYGTWGIVGHSQGAVFANQVISDPRLAGVFPNVFLVNGTMMTDQSGSVIAGRIPSQNAQNVVIFYPKDRVVLPDRTELAGRGANKALRLGLQKFQAMKERTAKQNVVAGAEHALVAKHSFLDGKGEPGLAMDNVNQDPIAQIEFYRHLLGEERQVVKCHQLPINNGDELKRARNFGDPKATKDNFKPNVFGEIDSVWSAESLSTGRTLTVVDTQGGHMPAGPMSAYTRVHTAGMIADYFGDFVRQQRVNKFFSRLSKRSVD